MEHNYFVSVFVNGKHAESFFSEHLDELRNIRTFYPDCEICVFDMKTFEVMQKAQVEQEIKAARMRWKKSLEKSLRKEPVKKKVVVKKPKKVKPKKYWSRRVLCVETGEVFETIRECSEKMGIPYMTITNCLKNGNATRGLHFVNHNVRNDGSAGDKDNGLGATTAHEKEN